jgi:hypothetical protein
MSCKFCESYENYRHIHAFCNKEIPKEQHMKHEYTVALVIRSWCPKYRSKSHAARTVSYRNRGIGFELNYCPECGKKLRG